MRLPIPEPLLDAHPFCVEVDDLLGSETDAFGDDEIPRFFMTVAVINHQIDGVFLCCMVEDAASGKTALGGRKTAQTLGLALDIDAYVPRGSDEKRDAYSCELGQKIDPGVATIHDENGPQIRGEACRDRQNKGVLDDVLALFNELVDKAGECDGQDTTLADEPYKERGNALDGSLIEDHRESGLEGGSDSQCHKEGNHRFGSEAGVVEKTREPGLPHLGVRLKWKTAG